jgi:hypothetical protein
VEAAIIVMVAVCIAPVHAVLFAIIIAVLLVFHHPINYHIY